MSYNGWTNWDTWEFYIWVGGTIEDAYRNFLAIGNGYRQADIDKNTAIEIMKDYCRDTGICLSIGVDIELIDWDEILEAFVEE